jgi:hypothetical protein
VGDINSSGPLQTSRPEWADGFLAYFKAYTDEPNSSASVGKLEQLQLVWTSKSCVGEQKQQLAEAILGEARDPDAKRTTAKKQTPPAAAVQPAEADVQGDEEVSEVPPAEVTGAAAADPASATATVNATAVPSPAAADANATAAAEGVAEGEADAAMLDDMNAAAAAGAQGIPAAAAATDVAVETPAGPVAAVVTSVEVEEVVVAGPAEIPAAVAVPAAATAQPAAAATTTTTTTTTTAVPAAAPTAAKPAATATPKPASSGKSKTIFVGPQKRAPTDAPSSSTVINTTTIITSTTTDRLPAPTETTYTTSTLTSATTTTTAVCNPGGNCANGTCATSSCMLNGMGKDVATMMCFGTNLMPNPLLDATLGNPCTNLACKLDRPNCTTTNFGLDGFCTGREPVAWLGAAAAVY